MKARRAIMQIVPGSGTRRSSDTLDARRALLEDQ
jgi:hypothetical protein